MEALENRLEATESALIKVLQCLNEEALITAFGSNLDTREDTDRTRSADDKSALMSKWEELPLDNAENLQKWASTVPRMQKEVPATDPIVSLRGIRLEHQSGVSDSEDNSYVTGDVGSQAEVITSNDKKIDLPLEFQQRFLW